MKNRGYFRLPRRAYKTVCSGRTKDQGSCNNLGKADADGTYWCHIHKVQALSALILEESRD